MTVQCAGNSTKASQRNSAISRALIKLQRKLKASSEEAADSSDETPNRCRCGLIQLLGGRGTIRAARFDSRLRSIYFYVTSRRKWELQPYLSSSCEQLYIAPNLEAGNLTQSDGTQGQLVYDISKKLLRTLRIGNKFCGKVFLA